MAKTCIHSALLFVVAAATSPALASTKAPAAPENELTIDFRLVDVAGEGGFENQDASPHSPDSRSRRVGLDQITFETVRPLSASDNIEFEIDFTAKKADVDRALVVKRLTSLPVTFELGRNRPMIATGRGTLTHSLAGNAYWRSREFHLLSEVAIPDWPVTITGSYAMQRPLGTREVAEDESMKMLTYDDVAFHDGQTYEWGLMASASHPAGALTAWAYRGELIDDFDWKTQLSQSLGEYSTLGDAKDRSHHWYGGRLDVFYPGIHLRGEAIRSLDGLLKRNAWYVHSGFTVSEWLTMLPTSTIILRHGTLNVENHPEQSANPLTWDRTLTVVSASIELKPSYEITAEYVQPGEVTSDRADKDIDDDQFLARVRVTLKP